MDTVTPEFMAGMEYAARIAVFRSCSWSEADDRRSQDYREGIEDAASQIATRIRAEVEAMTKQSEAARGLAT